MKEANSTYGVGFVINVLNKANLLIQVLFVCIMSLKVNLKPLLFEFKLPPFNHKLSHYKKLKKA